MSALWTATEIAAATGGAANCEFEVHGVAFDSREVGSGDLFVAMKGEATDGHRFVDGAFERGATGAIVSQPVSHPHVLVKDSVAALEALGRAGRARTNAKIIGVTGSAGKTGTKETLAAALARLDRGLVHRSVKSYNNQTGVPLSLARMPRESAFGVLEMGMNHAGELAALTRMVRPHIAIITTVVAAHIEFFGTVEKIAEAKSEIFEGLEPGGVAIIPFDNPHRELLTGKARECGARVVTFGRGEGADVRALEAFPAPCGGTAIHAHLPEAELSFTLAYLGDHWVTNAMAVLAAVDVLGGDLASAGLAMAELEGLSGRGARHRIAVPNGGNALLIDESYNANPASMAATLAVLGAEPAKRRMAVLGEMGELGAGGAELHAELAGPVEQAGVDLVLLVGEAMLSLKKALHGRVECVHANAAAAATDILKKELRDGDVVLVKGSNFVGLSRLVAALLGGSV